MKKKLSFSIFATLCFLLLSACSGNGSKGRFEAGDTLTLRYARNLTIVDFPDHTEVTLLNPWDTANVLGRYYLSEKSDLHRILHTFHMSPFLLRILAFSVASIWLCSTSCRRMMPLVAFATWSSAISPITERLLQKVALPTWATAYNRVWNRLST